MILALSPHLDDAVFSCGGHLAELARQQPVVVATCFTRSMPRPSGFALACQLDKGLSPEVDYLALRREEDRQAHQLLGTEYEWWDLPEAPHRGYRSAAELFAGPVAGEDNIVGPIFDRLQRCLEHHRPETVFYPLGAGNHIDHRQLIRAVERIRPEASQIRFIQYYDQPYTAKYQNHYPELNQATRIHLSESGYDRKIRACAAYTTQIGFQFGDVPGMQTLLGRYEYFRPALNYSS